MQIYGILLRFRGIFTENAWKTVEKQWKIGEFPRNPFLEVAEPKGDPAVVSGRFRSFFRSFPVIFRLIPIDSD